MLKIDEKRERRKVQMGRATSMLLHAFSTFPMHDIQS